MRPPVSSVFQPLRSVPGPPAVSPATFRPPPLSLSSFVASELHFIISPDLGDGTSSLSFSAVALSPPSVPFAGFSASIPVFSTSSRTWSDCSNSSRSAFLASTLSSGLPSSLPSSGVDSLPSAFLRSEDVEDSSGVNLTVRGAGGS